MLGGLSLVQAVQCCTVIGCLEIMENCQRFLGTMKIYTMYIDMKKVKNFKEFFFKEVGFYFFQAHLRLFWQAQINQS